MIIIGAGLAGCLAACLERNSIILEASEAPSTTHKAVLRFREDKIARALGIPFKAVHVLKGVFTDFDRAPRTQCTLQDLNHYSHKVIGRYEPRSIIDLAPVTRWVAPEDLHSQMLDRLAGRIQWGQPVTYLDSEWVNSTHRHGAPVVSTMPMQVLAKATGAATEELTYAPIHVDRYEVANCSQHQTIYFPEPHRAVYRATLTGRLLLIESMWAPASKDNQLDYVLGAFGIRQEDVKPLDSVSQRYGKIHPLSAQRRKELLLNFTVRHNVYSLGRFACWRNVLLDDVYEDFFKIRSMISLNHYDLMRSVT